MIFFTKTIDLLNLFFLIINKIYISNISFTIIVILIFLILIFNIFLYIGKSSIIMPNLVNFIFLFILIFKSSEIIYNYILNVY